MYIYIDNVSLNRGHTENKDQGEIYLFLIPYIILSVIGYRGL